MNTIAVAKIFPISAAIERHGLKFSRVLNDIGMPPDIMESPDNQISDVQLADIMRKAVFLTKDQFFGLHAGEVFIGLSNILGFLLLNCATLGEAVKKYCEYQHVYDQTSRLKLHIKEGSFKLRIEMTNPKYDLDRHLVDLKMAGTLKYYEVLTGRPGFLKEACFKYSEPRERSEYKRIFNCPLNFQHRHNQLVFDEKEAGAPVLQPNKELKVVFEEYTRDLLKQMTTPATISEKVKTLLIGKIKGDVPDINAISENLGMGTRNLQLKLKKEGTTFSKLLDETRRDLALEYIKNNEISLAEISYILGFSELSVFYRCFKRWTNSTPGRYRKFSPIYKANIIKQNSSLD